jgi:acyl carrier protein
MNKETAKTILKNIHDNQMIGESELDFTKSLKEQGYDSLDEIEFIMEVEKATGMHEIDTITLERLTSNLDTFLDYIVQETNYKPV